MTEYNVNLEKAKTEQKTDLEINPEDLTPEQEKTLTDEEKKKRLSTTEAVGIGQLGMGLSNLLTKGPEPELKPSSELAEAISKAKAEGKYGLTPERYNQVMQEITANKNAAVRNALVISNRSASTAMANSIATMIVSDNAVMRLKNLDQDIQQKKERYADSLISKKIAEDQMLFREKERRYERDINAYSKLAYAGIANLIGAEKYEKEKSFLDKLSERNKITITPQ